MIFQKTKLEGVFLITPDINDTDFRGAYVEPYNKKEFAEKGINVEFVTDDFSISFRGVLRGLHGDKETYKLVSCRLGQLYLAVLNYDEHSPQFGQWQGFALSDTNHQQVLIPPMFANGHLALSERILFCYKQSEYYHPERQFSVKFNDPRFNIWWPIKNPILSRRDEEGKYVE